MKYVPVIPHQIFPKRRPRARWGTRSSKKSLVSLALVILFSTSAFGEAGASFPPSENHLGGIYRPGSGYVPGSGTAVPGSRQSRPVTGRKVCVCQYQESPTGCVRHRTEIDCRVHHDCIWATNGRATPVCRNWHQEYCETEFVERRAEEGCTQVHIVGSSQPVPVCNEGDGNYYYTYHGHGPRLENFLATARRVIRDSAPNCRLSFQDQSCQTFNVGNRGITGLPDVRDAINQSLRPLLHGSQTVVLTANQIDSTATRVSPYRMTNPSYSFVFNRTEITRERPVSCEAPPPACDGGFWGISYLCQGTSGTRRNTCCCGRSLLGLHYSCAWREGITACPR